MSVPLLPKDCTVKKKHTHSIIVKEGEIWQLHMKNHIIDLFVFIVTYLFHIPRRRLKVERSTGIWDFIFGCLLLWVSIIESQHKVNQYLYVQSKSLSPVSFCFDR